MSAKSDNNYLKKELYELIKNDESIFDFIQSSSLDGLWYWDLENPENEWMNPKFWTVLGYNPNEMPHKSSAWQDIINKDDLSLALDNFTKHCQNPNHPYDQIVRYTHKNGSIVWIRCRGMAIRDNTGKPIRMLGAHHDITEQKTLQINIEKSTQIYKNIIQSIPIGMFIYQYIEPDKLFLIEGNISAQKLTGLIIKDWIGREFNEIWPNAKSAGITDSYLKVAKFGEGIELEDIYYTDERVSGAFRIYAFRFDDNKIAIAFLNVTEIKKAEDSLIILNKELITAKEKAEESDRLKTAFLQNISHEIRTPLNAICGFSKMLNKPNLSDDKKNGFISIIQNSSNQLLFIVTDILTISSLETKQEKVNIEKVNVNSIIIELLAQYKAQSANQNISLYAHQQLNNQQAEVFTDKTKITQVLSNLLSNALKFTYTGSVEFGYNLIKNNEQSELEFYVKDTGIGIKTEQIEKIFERFRQADLSITKNYGGTGLGLSICKGFVELLGGKIKVESEPEKGSTFYFTVPYKPVDILSETNLNQIVKNKQITILVAEDEESNFLFIEELLLDFNVRVIHAKNGREAVDHTKNNSEIELIIMDIKMPEMDGHEAAQIIKQEKANLPIIAQSAYALEHERAKYAGIFDEYLTKPLDETLLKQKVLKFIKAIKN